MTSQQAPQVLNEHQKRRLRVTCEHIDRLLSEIEVVLNQEASRSVFPKYKSAVFPAQRQTIEHYAARIRAHLLRVLDGQEIAVPEPAIAAAHSIHVTLAAIEIAIEELYPEHMQGYGPLSDSVATALRGLAGELFGLVTKLDRYLAEEPGENQRNRIDRLGNTNETELLRKIEKAVSDCGLIEFRVAISNILDRIERASYEIAFLGRVNCGKSSLLNAVIGLDVLPVGVIPVTAVPTRITYGKQPSALIQFAKKPSETVDISRLAEFVSEQQNPENEKLVTRVVVSLPSARLQPGINLVDTPGLGSLASRGSSETLAYLPHCDVGVFLVDARSSFSPEDVATIRTLGESGIPVLVLLSKADLLNSVDQQTLVNYVGEHIAKGCNLHIDVVPISNLPDRRSTVDQWFEREVLPLYSCCHELRTALLKQKIGALRGAVISSLRVRLRESTGEPSIPVEQLRRIEARLRLDTGGLETLWGRAAAEMEAMFSDTGEPLTAAASAIVKVWATNKSHDEPLDQVVESAVEQVIEKRAAKWLILLSKTANDLSSHLQSVATLLHVPDSPGTGEFQSMLCDMPVFQFRACLLRIDRPAAIRVFGQKVLTRRVARAIQNQVGSQLQSTLRTYAGLWKKWNSHVLSAFRNSFDSYADSYRAQAETILSRRAMLPDEAARLQQNAQSLEANDSNPVVSRIGISIGGREREREERLASRQS